MEFYVADGFSLFLNKEPVSKDSLPENFAVYPFKEDSIWYRIMLNEYESVSFASPGGF